MYSGPCFDFLFFLRFSVDTYMSVKDFPLLLLGKKIQKNDCLVESFTFVSGSEDLLTKKTTRYGQ